MKTMRIVALVLFFSFLIAPFAFAAEWEKMIVPFALGTTDAGSATSSSIFRVPVQSKIESIYITSGTGAVANSSNYMVVTFYLNNAACGAFTSSSTALVANTPAAITPTGDKLAAGDTLQFKLTKVGTGTPTTDLGVTMTLFGSTSE